MGIAWSVHHLVLDQLDADAGNELTSKPFRILGSARLVVTKLKIELVVVVINSMF